MRTRKPARPLTSQEGFSMIEFLMTAFILAVGLLGLCMLQTMSLRASRGSSSLSTAAQVAQGVMDQVEMEGRLSWLSLTDTNLAVAPTVSNLTYMPLAVGGNTKTQTFNLQGNPTNAGSTDPTQNTAFFTAITARTADAGLAAGGVGQISDYTVTVTFSDAVIAATQAPKTRTVQVTRRIIHG